MVAIQNEKAITAIRDNARLSVRDGFPTQLANIVQPVMDMTPDLQQKTTFFLQSSKSNSGTQGLAAPSGEVRVFVTSIFFEIYKDVTCDIATSEYDLTLKRKGATIKVGGMIIVTLTAEQRSKEFYFQRPIEVDPGSQMSVPGTFTAGVYKRLMHIHGYTVQK